MNTNLDLFTKAVYFLIIAIYTALQPRDLLQYNQNIPYNQESPTVQSRDLRPT